MNNEETIARDDQVMDSVDQPAEDELVAPLDVDAEANDDAELEDEDEAEDEDDRSGVI